MPALKKYMFVYVNIEKWTKKRVNFLFAVIDVKVTHSKLDLPTEIILCSYTAAKR